ncbi:COG4223 family protein [Hyphomonas pacifica]|uniref:Mitochondrial inner membrane protein n=1 Tax=Hyphomonas pacifica TaxID=1280941 RepID=A0A062U140_9PROT|nr:hypothetical protein [Hyphomonas pacifica]KCZ51458.1 hypothetical protein HY2_11235 [Hyphomonas pacifica]RAN35479.1 hypothetical protein HY3_08030 [Hyphomonas pacifica]RAN36866.1 hypothetical protein HY11_11535 [Hyphomonas pacifica]
MTDDMSPEEPVGSVEPIDADFEPAPKEDSKTSRAQGGGPGWLGAIVLSLFAAGLGGLMGIAGVRYLPPQWDAANDMTGRLETLERRQGDNSVELSKLSRDQARMATDLKNEMKALGTGGVPNGQIKRLAEDLDLLSERLDEVGASGAGEAVRALEKRITALEEVDTSGAVSPQDLTRAVAGLETRLDEMEQALEALDERPQGVDPSRLATVEAYMKALRSDLEAAKLAGNQDVEKLTGLVEDMRRGEQAARSEAEAASETARIARSLSAIEAASRRGGAFESEYRALRSLRPSDPAVRQLDDIASMGAPTVSALQDSFAPARAAALKAIPDETGDRLSWLNRAFGDAVKVRKLDGDDRDPAAILDRADTAVRAGDIDKAAMLIAGLKGPTADAMADWTEQANRRITLEAALEALQTRLIEGDK